MIALVSADVMRECDAREVARRGGDALVARAGASVATEARRLLGGLYGRRVAVLVGPGLNGADGRVAASVLSGRGCRVELIEVAHQPREIRGVDLVIDAAFGLGCRREYVAPQVCGVTKVLAVDLPSGVDADSGALLGQPMKADVTLALGALKFAHVDGEAAHYVGEVRCDTLDIAAPRDSALIVDDDLDDFVRGSPSDHKWSHALSVFAGSPRMPGAAALVCRGALSAGASMVQLDSRGRIAHLVHLPMEVVRARDIGVDARSRSIVAGPGLGAKCGVWLAERLAGVSQPTVLDADALTRVTVEAARRAPRVLTPHAKEFERLGGVLEGARRIPAVRQLSADTGCIVLLKGPTTVIADPQGQLRIVNSGTEALATAGTGDVLAGMIGASLARGHEPLAAAALSAHLHALAGTRMGMYGSASSLPLAITAVIAGRDRRH